MHAILIRVYCITFISSFLWVNMCVRCFLFRMLWNKKKNYAIDFQICFRICNSEYPRKSGGDGNQCDVERNLVCVDGVNLLLGNMNTIQKRESAITRKWGGCSERERVFIARDCGAVQHSNINMDNWSFINDARLTISKRQ